MNEQDELHRTLDEVMKEFRQSSDIQGLQSLHVDPNPSLYRFRSSILTEEERTNLLNALSDGAYNEDL